MGEAPQFFDEMDGFDGTVRAPYGAYASWLQDMSRPALLKKSLEAQAFFRRTGITFNVYGQAEADERLIPFDLIPRIIGAHEWANLVRGIEQRVKAINAFLHDIYHRQEILRAGRVPERLIRENAAFLPKMIGMDPPGGIYTHIVGVDLVRTGPNEFYVLEDNARTPSGVSYMLENRETMLKMFPELFSHIKVEPVQQYPTMLRRSLERCGPPAAKGNRPTVAVLTPGIHNSAYFEHAFLADQMGVELVEGHDLRVTDGRIAMRTTRGYEPVDVIYRRIDDDFLDPLRVIQITNVPKNISRKAREPFLDLASRAVWKRARNLLTACNSSAISPTSVMRRVSLFTLPLQHTASLVKRISSPLASAPILSA